MTAGIVGTKMKDTREDGTLIFSQNSGEPNMTEFMTEDSKEQGMRHYFGQSNGVRLAIRLFDTNAFGVIGARSVIGLLDDRKKERKKAFTAVRAMLIAFRMVEGKEDILSLSIGCDRL